jgi:outer membrane lipoprotein-sorting protein
MTFSNVKVNAKLDESLFKYTPPPGARVVTPGQGQMYR